MDSIENNSIDMVLCDLPYGTTALKWDSIIPCEQLWSAYKRICKPNAIIALFGMEPFSSQLRLSNIDMWRYDWIWKKNPTGFLNCNYKPLSSYEIISIFSNGTVGSLSKNPITYYPQGIVEVNVEKHNNPNSTWRENKGYPSTGNVLNSTKPYTQKYTNYPTNILEFARDTETYHPTQKPIALCEYLIKTYTHEGDVVLDNTCGSGTTCVAAKRTNRKYIGIEIDEKYVEVANARLE